MADINCVLYLNKFGLSPVVILKIKKLSPVTRDECIRARDRVYISMRVDKKKT